MCDTHRLNQKQTRMQLSSIKPDIKKICKKKKEKNNVTLHRFFLRIQLSIIKNVIYTNM